jgi:hypothetical protein
MDAIPTAVTIMENEPNSGITDVPITSIDDAF